MPQAPAPPLLCLRGPHDMQRAACQLGSRRGRPLRCSRPPSAAGAEGGSAPPVLDRLCRICWDTESADDGLVAPCACSGSMVSALGWVLGPNSLPNGRPSCSTCWATQPSSTRCESHSFPPAPLALQRYVHMQCLQHWQAQLRATKGLAAARRCDVCKERWAKCYQPPAVPTDWRTMLRDVFRSVPWPAVLEVRGGREGRGMRVLACGSCRSCGCWLGTSRAATLAVSVLPLPRSALPRHPEWSGLCVHECIWVYAWANSCTPVTAMSLRPPLTALPATPPLPQCWKFSVLAIGALQGVRAGVQGFRCGMQVGFAAALCSACTPVM